MKTYKHVEEYSIFVLKFSLAVDSQKTLKHPFLYLGAH